MGGEKTEWRIRAVSPRAVETRANCENKNGVRFSRAAHRFCPGWNPPGLKVWYRLCTEGSTPRSLEVCRPKETEENDIPRISIAAALQPVDFFIDNRDSVTSLRESYGSKRELLSELSFPFFQPDRRLRRFTIRRGRQRGFSWIEKTRRVVAINHLARPELVPWISSLQTTNHLPFLPAVSPSELPDRASRYLARRLRRYQ